MKLKKSDGRKIVLAAQGLDSPSPFGSGKEAVVKAVKQLGYVQIDTISVVQRAHHHVLWSRVPDYQPNWLHELQAIDKKIFEYWSHAAAFLPMDDFRFCLPRMIRFRNGEKHWYEKDKVMMKKVLKEIAARGPMLARDFENTSGKKAGPWFDRTPAKKALEYLFQEGRLVVCERRGFQKVYELPERYLPKQLNQTVPTESEYCRHLILSTLRANGFATAGEIAYLRKGFKPKILAELQKMAKERLIKPIEIENIPEQFFALKHLEPVVAASSEEVHILSPFDNLVIQRGRLSRLFDFSYQIECYVPEPKRKFGYFVLPILLKDKFIGRLDAKADRPTKTLLIKAFHLEEKVKLEAVIGPLAKRLISFAAFNGCKEIDLLGLTATQKKLFEKSF